MPSLPVDNQSLSSKEAAYRRYFGALKKSSPPKPRSLLLIALIKICCISLAASIPNFVMVFFVYTKQSIYELEKLYYVHNFARIIITFIWCLSVNYIIFHHKYANSKIMFLNVASISTISFSISTYLSYLHYTDDEATILTNTAFWQQNYWRLDIMYHNIFLYPSTLYFSILMMYCSEYCCSNMCTFMVTSKMHGNESYQERLIDVPAAGTVTESTEVFEYVGTSHTTGSMYGDDDIELSVGMLDIDNKPLGAILETTETVSFDELKRAVRSVVTRCMTTYCCIFMVVLFVWFLLTSVNLTFTGLTGSLLYILIFLMYYIAKWILKRSARKIDTAIIIPKFSFEILTEIQMSSLYWYTFRMFTLKYEFNPDSLWSFPVIGIIHIFGEIFQDSIRMSAGYFNWTGNMSRYKKSNITQWKVRGAIDTSIRFIIAVYSILFVTIIYSMNVFTDENVRNSVILNYVIFAIEMIHFSLIIFKPGCAGKISDQQIINMAEPLMRMFNANSNLFLAMFCGSMVIASLFAV